jgi:hypothetical protein
VDTLAGIIQQRTREQGRSDVLILDDLEGFHSRKLGRLNFEVSLVEKLCLTESTGIEVWEIFHSLKSSKLRPHFKTVFFNGSFATPANFKTLNTFITVKVPLASCMKLLESLWVKQEMPQYGTNTAGEAMVVETADGFLTPKDPDCRFLGISGGVVFKGLSKWRFKSANAQKRRERQKAKCRRQHLSKRARYPARVGAPAAAVLETKGRLLVGAGSADSVVRPNHFCKKSLKYSSAPQPAGWGAQ